MAAIRQQNSFIQQEIQSANPEEAEINKIKHLITTSFQMDLSFSQMTS